MDSKLMTFIVAFFAVLAISSGANAQEEGSSLDKSNLAIGAGIAIGISALGAGFGIGKAGAAAMGAIAERPESATWGLIIVALAEGVALYGLIIAFLIVTKI
jgi:V/A-type H+-transporting ATPase subunit K